MVSRVAGCRCTHLHVVLVLQMLLVLHLLERVLQTLKVERMLLKVVIQTGGLLRLIGHLNTTTLARRSTFYSHFFRLHPLGLGRFGYSFRFADTLLGCL